MKIWSTVHDQDSSWVRGSTIGQSLPSYTFRVQFPVKVKYGVLIDPCFQGSFHLIDILFSHSCNVDINACTRFEGLYCHWCGPIPQTLMDFTKLTSSQLPLQFDRFAVNFPQIHRVIGQAVGLRSFHLHLFGQRSQLKWNIQWENKNSLCSCTRYLFARFTQTHTETIGLFGVIVY